MDDGVKDFAAGVAAGVALVATGHPFDTVKVRHLLAQLARIWHTQGRAAPGTACTAGTHLAPSRYASPWHSLHPFWHVRLGQLLAQLAPLWHRQGRI